MEAVRRGKDQRERPKSRGGTAAVAEPQLEAWAALEEVGDGQDHVAAAGGARAIKVLLERFIPGQLNV
jgi:hypothetical protein